MAKSPIGSGVPAIVITKFFSSTAIAPKVAGMDNKNEYFNANFRPMPNIKDVDIVIPNREIPGNTESP